MRCAARQRLAPCNHGMGCCVYATAGSARRSLPLTLVRVGTALMPCPSRGLRCGRGVRNVLTWLILGFAVWLNVGVLAAQLFVDASAKGQRDPDGDGDDMSAQ
jgi:hypothetical protein